MWLRLSQALCKPPRSVPNSYFPWHTVVLHRTGKWIRPNKAILTVPVNLTKFEIRNYLTSVYGARISHVHTLVRIPNIKRVQCGKYAGKYYRNGPIEKRALVVAENAIPDAVKMLTSSSALRANPDILREHATTGPRGPSRRGIRKPQPIPGAWKHPIPKLLAPESLELNPLLRVDDNDVRMLPDLTKPIRHGLAPLAPARAPIPGVPVQHYTPVELRPWQKRTSELRQRGSIPPSGTSAGLPGAVPTNPLNSSQGSSVQILRSNRVAGGKSRISHATGLKKPQPTRWKPT